MNFLEFKKEANRANEAVDMAKAERIMLFYEYLTSTRPWSNEVPEEGVIIEYTYGLKGVFEDDFIEPYKILIGYMNEYREMVELDSIGLTGEGKGREQGDALLWRPLPESLKGQYFAEYEIKKAVEEELKWMSKEVLMSGLITDNNPKTKKMIEYLGSNWSSL